MDIRIEVLLDTYSESLRWIARVKVNGETLHEDAKYGGVETEGELARKMAEWLKSHGYPATDHYWLRTFTPEEGWEERPIG